MSGAAHAPDEHSGDISGEEHLGDTVPLRHADAADTTTTAAAQPEVVFHEDVVDHHREQRRSNGRLGAAPGLALDAGAALGRFGGEVLGGSKESVQTRMVRKMTDYTQKLRDVDLNDEWDEAVTRANRRVNEARTDFAGDATELMNEAAEDVLRRLNVRIEEAKETLLDDHRKTTTTALTKARLLSDLLSRDTRKLQFMCLLFFVLFIVAWELVVATVTRPKDCRGHLTDGAPYLQCYNAPDLLLNLNCSEYRCAVPWSGTEGDTRCNTCNCGGVCNHCTDCLCTVGYGASQYQVCLPYEEWPGSWARHVRWAIVGFWLALFGCFALNYFFNWYLEYRSNVALVEMDKVQAIKARKQEAAAECEREEIMGTHVEFFRKPNGLYHPDLVRAAAQQRMEERHVFKMPGTTDGDSRDVARKVGEGVDAFAAMLADGMEEVHDAVTRNDDLERLYSTKGHQSAERTKSINVAKKQRRVGASLSALKIHLGDPWLKETENAHIVPTSGELFDLYHKVARAVPPTPENLVKEMFHAKGIHASLPFLRKFLLREPARNQLPLTWREFYSEVCLSKDFIHQIRKGGADFAQYLTHTSNALWRENPREETSMISALLEIGKQVAPIFAASGRPGADDDSGNECATDDEGASEDASEDGEAKEAVDFKAIAAGITPYAVSFAGGRPLPNKSEAHRQKKAILRALHFLEGMMKNSPAEGEESDTSTEEFIDD